MLIARDDHESDGYLSGAIRNSAEKTPPLKRTNITHQPSIHPSQPIPPRSPFLSLQKHSQGLNPSYLANITANMSFLQDLAFRDSASERRILSRGVSSASTVDERRSTISRTRSYASTTATSVSISGDISSQLHGGYSHPLARSWQAERQLTKVSFSHLTCIILTLSLIQPLTPPIVHADLPPFHLRHR